MIDKNKLILRATVKKQVTEVYELDCTGMTMDDVKSEMEIGYPEDRTNWLYKDDLYSVDDKGIDVEIDIVEIAK